MRSITILALSALMLLLVLVHQSEARAKRDASETWEKIKEKVNEGVKVVNDAIPDKVKDGFDKATDTVADAARKVRDGAVDLYDKAKKELTK